MSRTLILSLLLSGYLWAGCDSQAPDALLQEGDLLEASSRQDGTAAAIQRDLAALRRATASFHHLEKADAAGYGTEITPCWQHLTLGAQGYHFGNPELIDGTVSLLEPELLMYEPQPGGHMRLVGLEYVVPIDAWEGEDPPTLLGQEFHPHSFLPIYKLHVWLWRANPAGMFADWNPRVSCDFAAEAEYFD
jgi:hypothetical protein